MLENARDWCYSCSGVFLPMIKPFAELKIDGQTPSIIISRISAFFSLSFNLPFKHLFILIVKSTPGHFGSKNQKKLRVLLTKKKDRL